MLRCLSATLAAAFLWPAAALSQASVSFPERVCDVTRYGAKGTRVFLDRKSVV